MNTKILKSTKSGFKWASVHSVVLILIKIIRVFTIPKILVSTTQYGLFTSINYFTRYLQFSDFGAKAYFIKAMPHYYFNESEQEVKAFINRTFSFTLLSFLIIVVYLGCFSVFYQGNHESFYKTAYLLLIPITILMKTREILLSYANSIQNYGKSLSLRISNDVLSLVFILTGVVLGGAIGGVIGLLCHEILMMILTASIIRPSFNIQFSRNVFIDFKNYLRLFFLNLAELFNVTIDQAFILLVLSKGEYGLYAIALMLHWTMIAISNVFKTALVPKLMAYRKSNPQKVEETLHVVVITFFALCIFSLPFLMIGVDVFINLYLVKFIPGLGIYFYAIFSGILRSLNGILKDFYIAKNEENKYTRLMLLNTFIAIIIYSTLYFQGLELNEIIFFIIAVDLIMFSIIAFGLKLMKSKKTLFYIIFYLVTIFLSCNIYSKYFSMSDAFNLFYFFKNLLYLIVLLGVSVYILYDNIDSIKKMIEV